MNETATENFPSIEFNLLNKTFYVSLSAYNAVVNFFFPSSVLFFFLFLFSISYEYKFYALLQCWIHYRDLIPSNRHTRDVTCNVLLLSCPLHTRSKYPELSSSMWWCVSTETNCLLKIPECSLSDGFCKGNLKW